MRPGPTGPDTRAAPPNPPARHEAANVNIALLLDLAADTFGDRTALSDASGDLTFGGLRSLARASVPSSPRPDRRPWPSPTPHSAAVPTALFGAAWAGATYAPLNFRLPPASLTAQLERLDRPFTVAGDGLVGPTGTARRPCPGRWMADVGSTRRGDGGPGGDYVPEPDRPAVLLFTSGSSGTPKAALLTHENLLAYVMETVEFAGADEDEALLLAAPPFHIAGVAAVLSSVYCGRRILPLAGFDPDAWLRRAHGTTAPPTPSSCPPCWPGSCGHGGSDPGRCVSPLRSLSYGGARIAHPVLEQALELFPAVDFVNAYGLTETSSTIAVLGPEEHRAEALASCDPGVRRRLHPRVGRCPGSRSPWWPDGHLVEVDGCGAGEIRVRGPQVGGRYLDTAPGWTTTAG